MITKYKIFFLSVTMTKRRLYNEYLMVKLKNTFKSVKCGNNFMLTDTTNQEKTII